LFERRRAGVVLALMAAVCAGYSATNHWHWREPVHVPLSRLDQALPFVPAAMFVYVSHFVFLPGCLLLVRGESAFRKTVAAVLAGSVLSNLFFVLVPTTNVRGPVPEGLAGPLFAFIAFLDTPANCFPSQHVGLAVAAAWGLREDRHPWASAALAWAGAISVSTVLVRQHYAADVAGGLALAALSWLVAGRRPAAAPLPQGEPA
jgi:membrane-associated phospholipid phosphatase